MREINDNGVDKSNECACHHDMRIDRIPKIIHYCWFGRNSKPAIVEKCIDSWKKFLPDWEIKEWNEDNFDVTASAFTKDAYDAKKWAFVSDVARLQIVYNEGGVYLDTDVELKKSLNDLLSYDSFFAFENMCSVNSGVGFGAAPGHDYVKAMLNLYGDIEFWNHGRINLGEIVCPELNTKALISAVPEFVCDGEKTQSIHNNRFLAVQEYSTYAVHHGAMSWVDGPHYVPRKRTNLSLWVQGKIKQPKIYAFVNKHLGGKAAKLYKFIAFDLFDCGIGYFVRRGLFHILKRNKKDALW